MNRIDYTELFNDPRLLGRNTKNIRHADNEKQQDVRSNLARSAQVDVTVSEHKTFYIASRVINEEVNHSLADKLEQEPKKPALFDPKEVVKNVLSFIQSAINKAKSMGHSEDQLTSMFEQARAGVNEGVEQAKSELTDIGVFDDDISSHVDDTHQLLNKGIDRFEKDFYGIGNDETEEADSSEVEETNSRYMFSESINYGRQEASQIEINTTDGDKVVINFAEAFSYSSQSISAAQYNSSNSEQYMVQTSDESSNFTKGFSYSVEGEIDDDEKEALNALLSNMANVADEFFNGNVEQAFKNALNLGFDDSEIASFAMNLQHTEAVKATRTYQSYQPVSEVAQKEQAVAPLSDYVNNLVNIVEQGLQMFEQSRATQALMNDVASKVFQPFEPESFAAKLNQFHHFNNQLISSLPQFKNAEES